MGALVAVTVLDGKRADRKEVEALRSKFVLRIDGEAITRLELRNPERAIVLERASGARAWKMTAPIEDEADTIGQAALAAQPSV